jgi:hypothetical protein
MTTNVRRVALCQGPTEISREAGLEGPRSVCIEAVVRVTDAGNFCLAGAGEVPDSRGGIRRTNSSFLI